MTVLYILWLLVNIALAAGLLLSWYRCLQLFAQQYSRGAAVALCLITLTTCSSNSSNRSTNQPDKPMAIARSQLPLDRPVAHRADLLTLPLARLGQTILISPIGSSGSLSDSLRISHSVSLLGLQLGLRWESIRVSVNPISGRRVRYDVLGLLHWQLLNLSVYTQPLTYEGTFGVGQ